MRIQATDEQIRASLAELLEAQEAARRRFIDKDVKPAVAMAQAISAVKTFLKSVTPADTEFPVLGAATLAMADRARGINEPYLRRSEVGSSKRKSTTSLIFWAEISTLISYLCRDGEPSVLGRIPLSYACKWVAFAMKECGFQNSKGEPFQHGEVLSRHNESKRHSPRFTHAESTSGLLDKHLRKVIHDEATKRVNEIIAGRIEEADGNEDWLEERALTLKVMFSLSYLYHPVID